MILYSNRHDGNSQLHENSLRIGLTLPTNQSDFCDGNPMLQMNQSDFFDGNPMVQDAAALCRTEHEEHKQPETGQSLGQATSLPTSAEISAALFPPPPPPFANAVVCGRPARAA